MDQPYPGRRAWIMVALLAATTVAAFWPVFTNGFIRYDDATYVTDNARVLRGLTPENLIWALQTGHAANWHPITWVSHMLDVQFFGLRAGWHHAVSLALHVANTLFLFWFLLRTTRGLGPSACVAALFALHPLHVESVAWVAERKDVLSGLFFFLTLLAYSRYVELTDPKPEQSVPSSPSAPPPRGGRKFYVLALVSCALGLMSKPMLVTLPFVLVLLDVWPLRRSPAVAWSSGNTSTPVFLARLFRDKVPFFILAILSSAVTYLVQRHEHAVTIALPWSARISNAVASYVKYIAKMFWPLDLAVFYPHPDTRYPISDQWPMPVILAAAILLLALTLLCLRALRKSPWFAVGWLFFLGTLVPVIGLVQVGGQAMADRYTYLPLTGLFICLVYGGAHWLRQRGWGAPRAALVPVPILAACAVLTSHQAALWKDNLTVFEHALAVTHHNAVAHTMLGTDYGERGDYPRAALHFQAAIREAPANADGYFGLGYTYEMLGQTNQALQQYQTALRLRPWDEAIHWRLGVLALAAGDSETAIRHFVDSVRLNPDYYEGQLALGSALAEMGKLDDAMTHLRVAMWLRPDSKEAIFRSAVVASSLGEPQAAAILFRNLIRLDPTNPEHYINLGGSLWSMGRTGEALVAYTEAVKVRPDHPVAHYNLATALLAQNRPREAAAEFAEAVRLKPEYPEALTGWGRALVQEGDVQGALGRFDQSLRLRADAFTFYHAGLAHLLNHEPQAGISNLRKALDLRPDWVPALTELAWALATHPDPSVRNGPEAVRLAERACELTQRQEIKPLAALDAAYAEANRFEDAIATATKVRELAAGRGESEAVAAADARLNEYRQHRPYRPEAPSSR